MEFDKQLKLGHLLLVDRRKKKAFSDWAYPDW